MSLHNQGIDSQRGSMSSKRHRSRRDAFKREAYELWNNLLADKPTLPFLIPLFLLAWLLERWVVPFSNWVPLFVTVWATIQYGRYQRRTLVEDLNNRWKRHILYTSPSTPLEPCEWLNKLIISLWPNFMEPKLSQKFSNIMLKRFKEKKPKPIASIELQEFSLGLAPPIFGLQRTYWATEGDKQVLRMGFEWDTNEMSVLLAAKLAGPFKGLARIAINSLHIKGDLRIVPILDGQAVLYSFESTPEVRIGVVFGSGSQSAPATELPGVPTWLEKLFTDTLNRTMVEPRRRCFSLPAVDMKKHATGGIISVTVISGNNLAKLGGSSRGLSERKLSSNGNVSANSLLQGKQMSTFVEVTLEDLTRKTHVSDHNGSSAIWDDTFNMVLHENSGTIHFNVYEQGSSSVKYDFLGTCEIKMKYVDDDSTIFWAIGPKNGVYADHAEHCGREVVMEVPIEGNEFAEIKVKLVIKEWHFADGSRTASNLFFGGQLGSLSAWPSFLTTTGRTLRISVLEGRNLAAKDRTGKSDPYVRLRYGKIAKKTPAIIQDLNPIWNQTFDFPELGGGEYLQLKCFDADLLTDENLGSARVNLEGLEDGMSRDMWVPLEKVSTGEIRLKVEAIRSELDFDGSQNGFGEGNTYKSSHGVLELVLVEARDLVAADWRGTSDPFVSVHYGNQKKRTKVIHKTLHPQWNQTLEFADDGKPLLLYVKDHNTVLPTSNIGHCKLEYERVPPNQTVDRWIPLQGVRKGEIHVQFTRRFHEIYRTPSNAAVVTTNTKLQRMSTKVRDLLRQAHCLADGGDTEEICEKLEEIETIEDEQDGHILQLLREREMLLAKIKDLGKAMEGMKQAL